MMVMMWCDKLDHFEQNMISMDDLTYYTIHHIFTLVLFFTEIVLVANVI
jgi:hypothetical protein